LSDRVTVADVLAGRPAREGEAWRRLALGLRVEEIPGPVRLTLAGPDDLAGTARRLAGAAGGAHPVSRPLLGLAGATRGVGASARMERASLARADMDVLAGPFWPVFDNSLGVPRTSMAAADQASPSERRPVAESDAELDWLRHRIALHDVRGAQIGNHNLQLNTFVARPEGDGADITQARRGHRAVQDTQHPGPDPETPDRRKALISQLEDEGWRLTPTRAHLEMAGPEPTFMDFMMSLIGFDVRGVQEG